MSSRLVCVSSSPPSSDLTFVTESVSSALLVQVSQFTVFKTDLCRQKILNYCGFISCSVARDVSMSHTTINLCVCDVNTVKCQLLIVFPNDFYSSTALGLSFHLLFIASQLIVQLAQRESMQNVFVKLNTAFKKKCISYIKKININARWGGVLSIFAATSSLGQ